jgi:hypothetical protein
MSLILHCNGWYHARLHCSSVCMQIELQVSWMMHDEDTLQRLTPL